MGLDRALAAIKGFHDAGHGDVWQPAPLIERLAAEGSSFQDHDQAGG